MQLALRLFRQSFEQLVRKGELPALPGALPRDLRRVEGGVFAAAFENPGRKPRGRVGSYRPTAPSLAEEIQAQASALRDAFPFRKEDLPFLTYELLLTGSPEFLADVSSLPAESGLLVRSSAGLQGVSLPGAAPRSPEERFREACLRAGLSEGSQTEDVRTYVFNIQVLRETS